MEVEMKLVVVDWLDSRSDDGWTEQDSLEMRVAEITTVGQVAKETEDVLCVASSVDAATGQLSGIMFIPKCCIVKRWDMPPSPGPEDAKDGL